MTPWLIDLDGSVLAQQEAAARCRPSAWAARDWGRRIRLGCRLSSFRRFVDALHAEAEGREGQLLSLYGSGDFHHVTLALLSRLASPFNLLVLDKHPDWMRGIPFMHCGTWLHHAAGLPNVRRIFHVGGELDFDNGFRWLAPWPLLRSGRLTVLPAVRRFRGRAWSLVPHEPLREEPNHELTESRLARLLRPFAADLKRYPLYISLDKDVMTESEAAVNWDSGHLRLAEVCKIVSGFLQASGSRLAGADLLGDWSAVDVSGCFRRLLHFSEHPALLMDRQAAAARNQRVNLAIMDCLVRQGTGEREFSVA